MFSVRAGIRRGREGRRRRGGDGRGGDDGNRIERRDGGTLKIL